MLDDTLTETDTDDAVDEASAHAPWLHCLACDTPVALDGARMSFDGGHRHHFHNPHGFEFDIGLFAEAPGCAGAGAATEYFSWFAGYRWRPGHCTGCGTHLGWRFECVGMPGAGEPAAFVGLVLARLTGG